MKNLFFMVGVIISVISSTSADTKLEYKDGYYISKSKLNALPNRKERRTTTLNRVKITAPSDGDIVVTSSGKGCIYTKGEFIELILSDNYSRTLSSNTFSWVGAGRTCGIDEVKSYSFRHVEAVKAGTTHTYQILGQRGSKRTISGNIYMGALVAVFYSKENQKYGNKSDVKKTLLANGTIKIQYPDGKEEIVHLNSFNHGTIPVNSTTTITLPDGRRIVPKKSQVQKVSMPKNASTDLVAQWLDNHAQTLLNTIEAQVPDTEVMQQYKNFDTENNLSIFAVIDRRSQTINYLFSPIE